MQCAWPEAVLARLQRWLTCGALALAITWFVLFWRAGQPGWACAGLAIVLFGHSAVLALEFALMSTVNRHDSAPPASVRQRIAAWWGESCAATKVFCWRQPFRSRRWPDLLPPDARGRRGVVLVHGFVCNRGLWNGWMARLHALHVPFAAVDLEPVFGSIDDYAPLIDAAVHGVEQTTALPPVIVAHSMGGLAVRRWLAGLGEAGQARAHHVVTIGSPHAGTGLARWGFSRNARQMRRASRWLRRLHDQEAGAGASRFTCFYSHCDNIVFPATTATLPGADNRHLPGVAHVQMADRPEPFEAALRHLRSH
jgi:triacylglycerol esterase/lipase EstA (alpha/beta hydrolase family)